jgi:hypothetical protein
MQSEYTLSLPSEPIPNLPTGDDYRDLVNKIREVARHTRLPVARRELIRLAASYDRRADHLDHRNPLLVANTAKQTTRQSTAMNVATALDARQSADEPLPGERTCILTAEKHTHRQRLHTARIRTGSVTPVAAVYQKGTRP